MQDTAVPQHKMTVDEFLDWYERQPKEAGRFELWHGRVVQTRGAIGTMNAERAQHWEMKAALYRALLEAVRTAGIEAQVAPEGPGVPLSNDTTPEPDALVYLGSPVPRDSLVVPNPIVVCEVLSPSTARHDLVAKLEGYFSLESVEHYLIADPDGPLLIHHKRGSDGAIVTRCISDANSILQLDPPGLAVSLGEVLLR